VSQLTDNSTLAGIIWSPANHFTQTITQTKTYLSNLRHKKALHFHARLWFIWLPL